MTFSPSLCVVEWKRVPPLWGGGIFGWWTLPHRLPFDSTQGRRSGLTTVAPPALWIESWRAGLKGQRYNEESREKIAAGRRNFSVVRGLGTWHCLPAGQPGPNGVPTPIFQGRVYECAVDG